MYNIIKNVKVIIMPILVLLWACTPSVPIPPPDLKDKLIKSLQGEDVDGFRFTTEEDENQTVASLTNSALGSPITLNNNSTNIVLKYTLVKEKKSSKKKTYKTEVVKKGKDLMLVVTDVSTGKVISDTVFPKPERHDSHNGSHFFDTLEECIEDFYCTTAPALQCEANRTCEDQFVSLKCCLSNGLCYSVHFIIKPNNLKCRLSVLIPSRGVFVNHQ